jgi:hypothetical protein
MSDFTTLVIGGLATLAVATYLRRKLRFDNSQDQYITSYQSDYYRCVVKRDTNACQRLSQYNDRRIWVMD